MTRLLLLAPFLLLVACEEDVLEPPASAAAPQDRDDLTDDRVTVELTRHGLIRMGGKVINLDQFEDALRKAALEYDAKMKGKGKSGWEMLPGAAGFNASRMNLVIRADKEAPWQHVQWLLTAAAQQRYNKIYFGATRADGKPGRVDAFLPTDKGLNAPKGKPIILSVHVVADKEKPYKWGNMEVTKPTEFRYKYGDREAEDVKAIAKWILEGRKTAKGIAGAEVRGEIKAGHKVPFGKIVELMDVMRAAGQKKIEFYGTQIATAKLRKKMRLPYPKSNYGRKK